MIYKLFGSVSSLKNYWGAGGGGAHQLHLLFCKSVYFVVQLLLLVLVSCWSCLSLSLTISTFSTTECPKKVERFD